MALTALTSATHVADFSARAADSTTVLRISTSLYELARRATKLADKGESKAAARLMSRKPPVAPSWDRHLRADADNEDSEQLLDDAASAGTSEESDDDDDDDDSTNPDNDVETMKQ